MSHHRIRLQTFVILGLFVVVASVFSAFVYFYQSGTESLLREYVANIATCENITREDTCNNNYRCEGVYMGTPAAFVRCQTVPDQFVQRTQQYKIVCEQTGGTWHVTKLSESCLCPPPMIFDELTGCQL